MVPARTARARTVPGRRTGLGRDPRRKGPVGQRPVRGPPGARAPRPAHRARGRATGGAEVNRKAIKMGAVEKIGHGLYASVEKADMVILALPLDQVHETLQAMAQDVREEAVVIDTARSNWRWLPGRRNSCPPNATNVA